MAPPYSLVRRDATASTQDDARAAFTGDPVVVVADRQTAGRGRGRSGWENAPRAVAVSVAFAPEWPPSSWPVIPLLAGVAVSEVLDVSLKWPNDVVRDDDKLGGILVESADGVVVAGVGLNLWWPGAPDGMGAAYAADPGSSRGPQIAESWVIAFLGLMDGSPESWPRATFRDRCVTLGRPIVWDPDGYGLALDIDDLGGLVVENGGNRTVLRSGSVRHVRPAGR